MLSKYSLKCCRIAIWKYLPIEDRTPPQEDIAYAMLGGRVRNLLAGGYSVQKRNASLLNVDSRKKIRRHLQAKMLWGRTRMANLPHHCSRTDGVQLDPFQGAGSRKGMQYVLFRLCDEAHSGCDSLDTSEHTALQFTMLSCHAPSSPHTAQKGADG